MQTDILYGNRAQGFPAPISLKGSDEQCEVKIKKTL